SSRHPEGSSQAAAYRDRVDQLADAMHAQGDLRAVPAAAPRPAHRKENLRVLLLQPGPGPRQRRLRRLVRAAQAEFLAGETDLAVDPWLHAAVAQATPARLTGARGGRLGCSVPVLAGRDGERYHRDALLEQVAGFLAGRHAADAPLAGFLAMDAARFGREIPADVLGVEEDGVDKLVQVARLHRLSG